MEVFWLDAWKTSLTSKTILSNRGENFRSDAKPICYPVFVHIFKLPQSADDPDIETQLVQLTNLDKAQGNLGLVISGNALEEAIKVEGFYDLLETLSAVVCFRANPSQKAVVSFFFF